MVQVNASILGHPRLEGDALHLVLKSQFLSGSIAEQLVLETVVFGMVTRAEVFLCGFFCLCTIFTDFTEAVCSVLPSVTCPTTLSFVLSLLSILDSDKSLIPKPTTLIFCAVGTHLVIEVCI